MDAMKLASSNKGEGLSLYSAGDPRGADDAADGGEVDAERFGGPGSGDMLLICARVPRTQNDGVK